MNSLTTPPGLREKVQTVILNLYKPCLIHMSLCGLVPYNLTMKLNPINLFLNVILSPSTFLLIFIFNVLDVRFLNVKTFDLIPAIILYVYNITLCVYLLFNFVQNLRKHRRSAKIIDKLVHIDTQLISLLHLSLTPFNSLLYTWVLSLTLWNICLYSFFFLFTLTLFPYPIHRVAGFMGTIVNNNAIFILLLAKQRTLRVRFDILTNLIWSVRERKGAKENEIRRDNRVRKRSFYSEDDHHQDNHIEDTHQNNLNETKNRGKQETHGDYHRDGEEYRDPKSHSAYSNINNATSGSLHNRKRLEEGTNATSGNLLDVRRRNDITSGRIFFLRDNRASEMIERNNTDETDAERNGTVIDIIPYGTPWLSNRSGHIARHHGEKHERSSKLVESYREIKENDDIDDENHTIMVKPSGRTIDDAKDERLMRTNDIYHEFETRIKKNRRQHDEFIIGPNGRHWNSGINEHNTHGMGSFPRLVEDLKNNEVIITRQNSQNFESLLRTLENVVKIHFDICELCTDLNNRYSYQILASLSLHFLSLCSSLYSCIAVGIAMHKSGFGSEEAKKMFYYGSWFVSQVFWIFLITQTSHDTVEQSHEARRLIHNFVIEETFPEIEHELDLMVRHLEKHQVLFSANGFFTVDYRIFCMMIGTAATYWMVLVQLDL